MDNEKKHSTLFTVLKVILVVAAVSFAAYKIYQKFFRKKQVELPEDEEPDAIDACEETSASAEEAAFEVSAQDVIANPESMEE